MEPSDLDHSAAVRPAARVSKQEPQALLTQDSGAAASHKAVDMGRRADAMKGGTCCWQLQWGFNGKSRDGAGVWDPTLSHHVLRNKDNWSFRLQQGRSGRPPALKAPEANTSSRKAPQDKLASIVLLRPCTCTHCRTFSALGNCRLTHFPHTVGTQQIFTVIPCRSLYL